MRLVALAAVALCAAAVPSVYAQEFKHRGWIGTRLANDKANGCAMALTSSRDGGFVVYANAEGAFKVGLASPSWRLEPGKEALAAIVFDDSPPIILKGSAFSANTVLFEPMDFRGEGGLEPLVEAARTVRMTYSGSYLRARLSGSARAIRKLRECAAAPRPERPESAPAAAMPDAGQDRAAEFGFLRQGMDASDANKRLLDAGWQSQGAAAAAGSGAEEAVEALRNAGIEATRCEAGPAGCEIDYADAYGNALRLTAEAGETPKLRKWRLNPDETAADRVRDEPDEAEEPR